MTTYMPYSTDFSYAGIGYMGVSAPNGTGVPVVAADVGKPLSWGTAGFEVASAGDDIAGFLFDMDTDGTLTVQIAGFVLCTMASGACVAGDFVMAAAGGTIQKKAGDFTIGDATDLVHVGLSDATSSGLYTGIENVPVVFTIAIDATGTPDTFTWNKDGGAETAGVAITGSAQLLSDGVYITFAATTGHTLADSWTITTVPADTKGSTAVVFSVVDATHAWVRML